MCNNFRLEAQYKDVAEWFELNPDQDLQVWERILFPKYKTFTIQAERKPAVLSWGFKHPQFEKKFINNCRSETAATSPMFRGPFKKQRCLLPATGFIEYNATKHKFLITLPVSPLFAFAGLYNSAGECTMLTTTPNGFMEKIHDRMPVILHKKDYDAWLRGEDGRLLVPYDGEMSAVCIGEPKPKPEPKTKAKKSAEEGWLFE